MMKTLKAPRGCYCAILMDSVELGWCCFCKVIYSLKVTRPKLYPHLIIDVFRKNQNEINLWPVCDGACLGLGGICHSMHLAKTVTAVTPYLYGQSAIRAKLDELFCDGDPKHLEMTWGKKTHFWSGTGQEGTSQSKKSPNLTHSANIP